MLVDKHYKYKKHIQRLNSALKDLLDLYEADECAFPPHEFWSVEEQTLAKAHASLKMTERHYKEPNND